MLDLAPALEKYAGEADLKLKERDKQIEDLRKSLLEAKRKSEQGSMETQGEALELVRVEIASSLCSSQ